MKIAKFLLHQEINVDQLDVKARSSLYLALESGFMDLATLLVEKGATVITSDEKVAKLLCVAGFEGNLELVYLLHKAGANLQIADYDLR